MKLRDILAIAAGTVLFGIAQPGPAEAATANIKSDVGYFGPLLDLSNFPFRSFSNGIVSLLGGISLNANQNNVPVDPSVFSFQTALGPGSYNFVGNGSSNNAYIIGLNAATKVGLLTFSSPVSSFGAYWNYVPGVPGSAAVPFLEAFDASGVSLGKYSFGTDDPISTPGALNSFQFRGITSGSVNIKSVSFGGSFLALAPTATGGPIGIRVPAPPPVSPVPLPAALPLLLGALALLGSVRRLRKLPGT